MRTYGSKVFVAFWVIMVGTGRAEDARAMLRKQAIEILRKGMAAESFWPGMHAAEGLTRAGLGQTVVRELHPRLRKEKDDRRRCGLAREIVRGGDPSVADVLARILQNPDSNAHINAAESTFKVALKGDPDALRRATTSGDPVLELMASAALFRAGDASQLSKIRGYLKHADARPRYIAAWILGQVGDRGDRPDIRQLARTETEPLAVAFAWNALAKLGDPEAREKVIATLQAEDATLRAYAAQTLGVCGDSSHLALLTNLLTDENEDAAIRAAEAIVRITNRMEPR